MKELVLGGDRAVSMSLLVDRSCGICSPLCSLMSLPSPTHLMMKVMSYPPFGKRDKPDCEKSKERSSQSKEKGESFEVICWCRTEAKKILKSDACRI